MKKIAFPVTFLILIYCLAGCYYDSEEALFGKPGINTVCDTTVTNFSTQIKPILQSNCYSCHSNAHAAANGSGIGLENYADVKLYSDNGRLVGSIEHTSNYPMPKNGGTLSTCDINIIKIWIRRGTLNN
jgi:hypothetical protein